MARFPKGAVIGGAVLVAGWAGAALAEAPPRRPSSPAVATDAGMALRLARAARAAGDLSTAFGLYRGLTGDHADPAVIVEFGDALLEGGLIDDAISAYQRVPVDSPAELGALLGLQRCHARLGRSDRALEYAQRAASLAPDDERALVNLGVALDVVGRHLEAQTAYRKALGVNARSLPARSDLALSLALTGQFQEAIDLLEPIAGSSNASPRVRQNLALVYGLKGDRERALALSRVDLDAPAAEANLRFFEAVRAGSR